ncbi:MAG: class I SAM-dependent methyltransferase [Pseudomonadales bacterium]|nr:class I SAM-dependent methyltransferase [Pseudomonadales bacterium]MBO6595273.1 class I SAM-dependent methyltransferase [Pseudomonadales bacterium]MBO6655832.1 class I SAM-dependent methyltransferase [Pseudomonadales bacterium]MBO6701781.1 class I SAM-dependent methyltransferase [Pseudomonadales bacterium]MBO7007377.1 class I SAM-dependent methyltransferase [Pseudomonadales bacterium]
MGIYEKYFLPKLLNLAMKAPAMKAIRKKIVPLAEGNVLEVGIGSGLNLPFYDKSVKVTGLDPSLELQVMAQKVAAREGVNVDFISVGGEEIPAEDNSFDSVVMTWTLCTIPDPITALSEIRRVLKPNGKILFAEHGEAPDANVAKWQARLNPYWNVIGGGCNLNRRVTELYEGAAFTFDDIEKGYIEGPKIATYTYRGIASIA